MAVVIGLMNVSCYTTVHYVQFVKSYEENPPNENVAFVWIGDAGSTVVL